MFLCVCFGLVHHVNILEPIMGGLRADEDPIREAILEPCLKFEQFCMRLPCSGNREVHEAMQRKS